MKFTKITKFAFATVALVAAANTQAALIGASSSNTTVNRTCPGLSNPNYVSDWKDAILAQTDFDGDGLVNANEACFFNGGRQQSRYNQDGTTKPGFESLPVGVPFTSADVGGSIIDSNFQESLADNIVGPNPTGFANSSFDDVTGAFLPSISVGSTSDANERNSANSTNTITYVWTGDDATLNLGIESIIDVSDGIWDAGETPVNDYIISSRLYVSLADADNTFIIDFVDSADVEASGGSLFDNLNLSFDVTRGLEFTIGVAAQAFGLNGGSSTVQMLNTSITDADGNDISALLNAPLRVSTPSTFGLAALGLIGFVAMRRRTM